MKTKEFITYQKFVLGGGSQPFGSSKEASFRVTKRKFSVMGRDWERFLTMNKEQINLQSGIRDLQSQTK